MWKETNKIWKETDKMWKEAEKCGKKLTKCGKKQTKCGKKQKKCETDKIWKETNKIWKGTDKMRKEAEKCDKKEIKCKKKQTKFGKKQIKCGKKQTKCGKKHKINCSHSESCKAIQVYSKWRKLSEGGKDSRRLHGLKWWILFCSPNIHYSQQQMFLSTLRPCVNESRRNGRCGQCWSVVETLHT